MIRFKNIIFIAYLITTSAYAQTTMEGPFNSFESSFSAGEIGVAENIIANTRDSNMNRTVINGGFGASATAIGNLVNVVTTGSGNTVVVNAKQVNTGSQTAVVGLSGGKLSSLVTADHTPTVSASTAPNNTAAVTTQGSQK